MPNAHATLSPSSSSRWIACPGSVRLSALVPRSESSSYSRQGTAAHALGELKADHLLLRETPVPQAALDAWWDTYGDDVGDSEDLAEMHRHTDAYVRYLAGAMTVHPGSALLLEQRVATGLPKCWGTSDAVIVSPVHVEAVDFKYGAGVPVSAYENSQLMLYGVGALEQFGDLMGDVTNATVTVIQPRSGSGEPDSYSLPADELRAWRDSLLPVAQTALYDDNSPLNPTTEGCRFCPAAGSCRARMESALQEDFGSDPDVLGPEELADVLPRLAAIRSWCKAVEEHAFSLAHNHGTEIPGYKLAAKGGRRTMKDAPAAIQAFIDHGFQPEQVATFAIKPFGHLEKLAGGRKAFDEIAGPYVGHTSPKPTLVPEHDSAAAYDPAAAAKVDFA